MTDLVHQRCFNHGAREAVARCPECRHYYCRECITEHEGRVVCARCLEALVTASGARRIRRRHITAGAEWVVALAVAWVFFYLVGRLLLALPDTFHDGSLWRGLAG